MARALVLMLLLLPGLALAQSAREALQNPGFETGDLGGLPGWEPLAHGQPAVLDPAVSHSGSRSLCVSAHGGMRSELVPYAGGRVLASGWMRTQDVVTGPSAPWHKAALQIISYDAERRPVGHFDVALVDGTTDWTRQQAQALFSRAVAYLSLDCHIWGDDASGTVWFDDLSLQLLDDPRLIRRKPLELTRATVRADFGRDLGEFRHLWVGNDVSFADRAMTDTQISAMRQARGPRPAGLHDPGEGFSPRIAGGLVDVPGDADRAGGMRPLCRLAGHGEPGEPDAGAGTGPAPSQRAAKSPARSAHPGYAQRGHAGLLGSAAGVGASRGLAAGSGAPADHDGQRLRSRGQLHD